MSTFRRLNKLLQSAYTLSIDEHSKIVLMSDCHRGSGTWNDNFLKNQNLFFAALSYYYQQGFTYIELGDGDELWENRKFDSIVCMHSDAFWMMSQFYQENRFYMLYGNHDGIKKNPRFSLYACSDFIDEKSQQKIPLFPGIVIPEALALFYPPLGKKILLVHGHQGDLINDTCWKLSRFLVRYIWKPLELAGINDPTSAAKNYRKKDHTEKKLIHWCEKNNTMLIAGHTHRPVFPKPGSTLYFNDGSCVHPRCITAIEIVNGSISLVKWAVQSRVDLSLFVGREILEMPVPLTDYIS